MLAHVTQTLFKSLLAKKDSPGLLRLVSAGYLSAGDARKALDVILEGCAQAPNLQQLRDFMLIKQASDAQVNKAGQLIFDLAEQHDNLEARRWFMEQYPATGAALQAADKFCSSLFAGVSGINSLEAYNDFILICPYSAMLPEAERLAGELDTERSKPGFFSNRDQRARELAARITGMVEKSAARNNEWYSLIINRMLKMQQELFGSRPATAKLLETPEVGKALKAAARCSSKIEKAVKELAIPGSKAAALLRSQAKLTRAHFENGAEDEALQKLYESDRQSWNAILGGK